ncbi:MAG: hypothetical protein PHS37_10065, partial [Candidatus Omnitrophica bacterium]|nr:hypothetical protein [Candidatus Omnitrophota bacterium]
YPQESAPFYSVRDNRVYYPTGLVEHLDGQGVVTERYVIGKGGYAQVKANTVGEGVDEFRGIAALPGNTVTGDIAGLDKVLELLNTTPEATEAVPEPIDTSASFSGKVNDDSVALSVDWNPETKVLKAVSSVPKASTFYEYNILAGTIYTNCAGFSQTFNKGTAAYEEAKVGMRELIARGMQYAVKVDMALGDLFSVHNLEAFRGGQTVIAGTEEGSYAVMTRQTGNPNSYTTVYLKENNTLSVTLLFQHEWTTYVVDLTPHVITRTYNLVPGTIEYYPNGTIVTTVNGHSETTYDHGEQFNQAIGYMANWIDGSSAQAQSNVESEKVERLADAKGKIADIHAEPAALLPGKFDGENVKVTFWPSNLVHTVKFLSSGKNVPYGKGMELEYTDEVLVHADGIYGKLVRLNKVDAKGKPSGYAEYSNFFTPDIYGQKDERAVDGQLRYSMSYSENGAEMGVTGNTGISYVTVAPYVTARICMTPGEWIYYNDEGNTTIFNIGTKEIYTEMWGSPYGPGVKIPGTAAYAGNVTMLRNQLNKAASVPNAPQAVKDIADQYNGMTASPIEYWRLTNNGRTNVKYAQYIFPSGKSTVVVKEVDILKKSAVVSRTVYYYQQVRTTNIIRIGRTVYAVGRTTLEYMTPSIFGNKNIMDILNKGKPLTFVEGAQTREYKKVGNAIFLNVNEGTKVKVYSQSIKYLRQGKAFKLLGVRQVVHQVAKAEVPGVLPATVMEGVSAAIEKIDPDKEKVSMADIVVAFATLAGAKEEADRAHETPAEKAGKATDKIGSGKGTGKGENFLNEIIADNENPTVLRIPVEVIAELEREGLSKPEIAARLGITVFLEVPASNVYVRLYSQSSPEQDISPATLGLGPDRECPIKVQDMAKANTVTLYASPKGLGKDAFQTLLQRHEVLKNTVLIPIGIEGDNTGIVRAMFLGFRDIYIARIAGTATYSKTWTSRCGIS